MPITIWPLEGLKVAVGILAGPVAGLVAGLGSQILTLALLRNDWGNDSQPIWADTRKELDALKADFLKAGMKDKAADLASRAREADVTDIVAVMSWNTDKTDIDLHVEEPGQQSVSYTSRSTFRGGNLDHDNTSGFGPETYTLRHAPPGKYTIKVHYYSGQPPTDVMIKVTRRQGGAGETTELFHARLEKAHDEQIVDTIDVPEEGPGVRGQGSERTDLQ